MRINNIRFTRAEDQAKIFREAYKPWQLRRIYNFLRDSPTEYYFRKLRQKAVPGGFRLEIYYGQLPVYVSEIQ